MQHYLSSCLATTLCVFLSAGTVLAQAGPTVNKTWRLYDTGTQQETSLDAMTSALSRADVVFFGEIHDDSLTHVLQDTLYGKLLAQNGNVALSLEMFESDVQVVVDEYLSGFIPLPRLIEDGRAWDNYITAYHPMVLKAKSANQPVIAANAPRRYVSAVGQRGAAALDEAPRGAKAYLPERPYAFIDTAYQRRFLTLMGGMPGHAIEGQAPAPKAADLNPFFAAQMLWDATMAHNIYGAWKAGKKRGLKVMHLCGSFHSDYREGTVAQLRQLKPSLMLRTVTVLEDQPSGTDVDWVDLAKRADYVFVLGE